MSNILFINHTNDVFGAENVLLKIIEYCIKDPSNRIYILEPNYKKNSTFKARLKNLGCENLIALPYKNLGDSLTRSLFVLLYNLYAIFILYFYVKRNKIKIIYSNTSTTCLGIVLAFLTQTNHVWHIHEPTDVEHGWLPSLIKLYRYFFSYKKNQIVFVSNKQCKQWKKQVSGLDDAIVIYNPIHLYSSKSNNNSNKLTVFGYLGSRDKRKNIANLIEAFAIVNKKNNDTQLILSKNIGDSNEIIYKKINHLNLEGKVIEMNVINAEDFYNTIDVLVLPSLSETWGLVVLEAMSAGKATIITNNTGLTEILEDGKHTLYVDPNNNNSIIETMIKMTDKNYRKQISRNGADLIDKMDFNKSFNNQIQLLFVNHD